MQDAESQGIAIIELANDDLQEARKEIRSLNASLAF